jgi:hypothetical protein
MSVVPVMSVAPDVMSVAPDVMSVAPDVMSVVSPVVMSVVPPVLVPMSVVLVLPAVVPSVLGSTDVDDVASEVMPAVVSALVTVVIAEPVLLEELLPPSAMTVGRSSPQPPEPSVNTSSARADGSPLELEGSVIRQSMHRSIPQDGASEGHGLAGQAVDEAAECARIVTVH